MSDMHFKLSGGCICGAVRYKVDAATQTRQLSTCHCHNCRRVTGTGHSQSIGFLAEDVHITGEPRSYTLTADSGNPVETCFCGTCGAPVFRRFQNRYDLVAEGENIVALHAGSLDTDCINSYRPDFKIGLNARPDWDNYV